MARQTTTRPSAACSEAAHDEQLTELARQGDVSAFGRLVERHKNRVLNTCWRICGNRDDAEDLAQEAFMKALEAISSFQARSQFYTWLCRIAVNVSLSHVRRQARAPKLSLHDREGRLRTEHQAAKLVNRVSADGQGPADKLCVRQTEQQLLAALARLDEDHRAIVVLRDIEGLDYQEISSVLEINIGTVKSRLHRARMELRAILRPIV